MPESSDNSVDPRSWSTRCNDGHVETRKHCKCCNACYVLASGVDMLSILFPGGRVLYRMDNELTPPLRYQA
jgi:hypothetical protein